jgi:catechol 2,3-dioxygenase-like lactoylglutathione lyase family enzyme
VFSGVNQVVLYVNDQLEAKAFWTEKMGCQLVQDDEYGDERWIAVLTPDGNTRLVLSNKIPGFEVGPVQDGRPHSNVFFYADDIEKAYAELSARGVEFPQPPVKQFFGWWSLFADQDGTRYALGERWGNDNA